MCTPLHKFLRLTVVPALLLICSNVSAQQPPVPVLVTDSMPATINGLQMGYQILTAGQKEVGNQGNFSRYSVRFFVTNINPEAKIILYKQGFNLGGGLSPEIVRFTCNNATGARLTTKMATLEAPACNVLAQVEDTDPATKKTKVNERFVQIGYWIRAGQTIHTDAIVIVPLGQKPNVTAINMFNANSLVGNVGGPAYYDNQQQQYPQQAQNPDGFIKLKSAWNGTYINNETGALGATAITDGWWSAQWQLLPARDVNTYYLKNRWKESYIMTDQLGGAILVGYPSPASVWIMIPMPGSNEVRFKNAMDGTYLNIGQGTLQTTQMRVNDVSARWILEPQQ